MAQWQCSLVVNMLVSINEVALHRTQLRLGCMSANRKPSQYICYHLGQLSLPSLQGRLIEYRPVWLGLRWDVFTCVGWQVTLCDLIWQVTPR